MYMYRLGMHEYTSRINYHIGFMLEDPIVDDSITIMDVESFIVDILYIMNNLFIQHTSGYLYYKDSDFVRISTMGNNPPLTEHWEGIIDLCMTSLEDWISTIRTNFGVDRTNNPNTIYHFDQLTQFIIPDLLKTLWFSLYRLGGPDLVMSNLMWYIDKPTGQIIAQRYGENKYRK